MVAPATAVSASPSQLVSPAMEVKESATEVKINLLGDILFDFDKATIRPAAEPTLAQVAALIRKYPNSTVLIEGHTDGKGSETYNLKLSEKRANSVRAWLTAHGIAEGTMRTAGWGAARPVAPNRKPNGADDPDLSALMEGICIAASSHNVASTGDCSENRRSPVSPAAGSYPAPSRSAAR